MSIEKTLVGVDIEDMTVTQFKKLLRGAANMCLIRSKREPSKRDEEDEEAMEENNDAVDLHEEKKGKSNALKVKADDLPEGIEIADDEEDEEDEKFTKKKGRA